ncbi:MAG: 50S ribosomal protein L29 [Simkaniaceae bacterium]|nr:50S ribosomal protein L29 [Simkaniaceae bacterium]
MLKFEEILNQSVEELNVQAKTLSRELFDLTNQLKVLRKLEKPHLLIEKRKDRARVLTALRHKQLQGANSK